MEQHEIPTTLGSPALPQSKPATLPQYQHADDAGADLRAMTAALLEPGRPVSIRTGVHLAIPEGHVGLVVPRSGMARDKAVTVINSPGVIDPNYRGDIYVNLINLGIQDQYVHATERVAQLVIVPYVRGIFVEVDQLDPTDRGTRGHGSTGTK